MEIERKREVVGHHSCFERGREDGDESGELACLVNVWGLRESES